jgi:O-acetyl-ADP-ribose deacetylase (regulator of RNase III)
MSIKIIDGNIFTSKCQTIVNTINCVGVMGAGIAFECRLRYPEMYKRYIALCEKGEIDIGLLWIYKSDRWILNFPTKKHWKYPSKVEYLHAGLEKFVKTYKDRGIESIAFPLLGSDRGGIPADESLRIMTSHLESVDLEIEIYRYNPAAKDDLYDKTKAWLLSQNVLEVSKLVSLRSDLIAKVVDAMQSSEIVQLNQLAQVKGVGIKTLEKVFILSCDATINKSAEKTYQQPLL